MVDLYTNRNDHFGYIRALACIAIIVLHTAFSASLLFKEAITTSENIALRAITNSMMWAVPCFVMVTGALLLDEAREISYKKLFGKYILRAFLALVIFGMIFRIFDMIMDKEKMDFSGFMSGFYEIFTGTSWSHMWYLYLLIGIYLLLPFYKKVVAHSSKNDLWYLAIVMLVFLSIMPLSQLWKFGFGFYINVATIYPLYLLCGYMINKDYLKLKVWQATLMFITSTALIALLTVVRWKTDNQVMECLWGYSSIIVILQSVSAYSIIMGVKTKGLELAKKILVEIDKCSFGIYLVHMIYVRLLLRYNQFNPFEHGGYIALIGIIIFIFIVSYITVWILKKLPVFKRIL